MILEIFSLMNVQPEVISIEKKEEIIMQELLHEKDYAKQVDLENLLDELYYQKQQKEQKQQKNVKPIKRIKRITSEKLTTGKLTKQKGVNYYKGHRETYYNLPMNVIIRIMKKYGNYKYWIRSDGVKMLNEYVMVAGNFKKYPRGSIVETSLGKGIIVDTGSFVKKYPNGFDIAVNW